VLARRTEGIFLSTFERGEIGRNLFRKACDLGLEGLVSKHREMPYWTHTEHKIGPAPGRSVTVINGT
jgi:ATP-dependent DNA ligase